jgi:putative hydroxymethylpyrimidine transport system substrate-binding protein
VVAALLLVGCGGGSDDPTLGKGAERLPDVFVTADGRKGAENIGILMAQHLGYFEEAGLDVQIGSPVVPSRPVTYVATGTDDIGLTQQPQLVAAKAKGVPVVAIGGVISKPTAAMIWLKNSNIHSLADLKGKTIAIPGVAFQEGLLGSVLAQAGLKLEDVKVRRVGYEMVSSLLTGKADALFGGSWNLEGAALEARGAKPVIKRVQELGVPNYEELVLVAREDLVEEDPELIRSFMAAVARGTAAAQEDPKGAIEMIEESNEASPEATPQTTQAQFDATLPLLSQSGQMNSSQTDALVEWMHEQGLIQSEPPASKLLTEEYLESP